MDRDEMLRVLRAFDREGLDYVLIGAAAMGFHGVVRATEDLDVVIQASAENVERLKRAFRAAYADDPHIDEIRAGDLLGDYPAIRYYPPNGDLYFDVMTRLGEVASFETVAHENKDVEGVRVRVATPAALYRLKKATVRPLDREDAEAVATPIRSSRGMRLTVERFRTIEEMAAAPVVVHPGEGFERFARHCARYWKIAPKVYPRGVYRFRSLAEAQAAREKITDDNAVRRRAAASDDGR